MSETSLKAFFSRPVQVLKDPVVYKYRGIKLTATKYLLSCGHETVRKKWREFFVCIRCYQLYKEERDGLYDHEFDPTGQRLLKI